MKKYNKFTAIFKSTGSLVWSIVSFLIIVFLIVLTILENTILKPIIGTVLGGPMPIQAEGVEEIYHSEYHSKQESKEAGDKLNVEIAEEGFTLLLNEDSALPMDKGSKVSVFGKNSVNLVLGGSGSGGGSGETAKTLFDGLQEGEIEYNPTLKSFYEDNGKSGNGRSNNPALTEGSDEAPTLDIGETPVNRYSADIRSSFREYNDAAIVVISRLGGESWDLPRSQNTANGGIEGSHYLQLDQNEYDLLDMVTSRFKKVIVLLNTLTSFQCDFIEEYNNTPSDPRIDAVLWIGGTGTTGALALGPILNGDVNPSGKTVDIYARDFTKDPTWQNFGDNSHVDSSAAYNNTSGQYYVNYEEGVYMGYRYYETRAYESSRSDPNWYRNNVIFPFGHGLSYTEFEQEIISVEGGLENGSSTVTITVRVRNIGQAAGKDVVQLYVNRPYYRAGIEKPYVTLVDYAKTPELAAADANGNNGGDTTVEFVVSAYDLASYDYNDANRNGFSGYELEHGDYNFFISKNSHVADDANVYDTATVALASDLTFTEGATENSVVENLYTGTENPFDDSAYKLSTVYVTGADGEPYERKGMSRTDFAGTFPTAPTNDERNLLDGELNALNNREHNNTDPAILNAEMPTTGADGDLTLRDLLVENENKAFGDKSVAYDDPRWEQILDRLTFAEMRDLVNNGAFQTAAIQSIGKNLTKESDGPIGFVNFLDAASYTGNTTFASEIVIGSTWNKDLAYRMGKIVGENGLWGDVNVTHLPYSGWYAPAVNLHRSPFSGRNFEYYSEDPVISGKMAVNVVNGARTKGVYTDLKHFALNDQETNRSGVATFCTEQALREMYLKPFEIAVKGSDNPDQVATAKADGIVEFKGTMGIMSSFNRIGTRWTGGDYRLMTQILRNEWGFKGLVICDYKTDDSVMNSRQMLYAGNDLILVSLTNLMWTDASASSAQDVAVLRQAAHRILYTVANSNSMNVDIIGYQLEWWITLTIVLDCIIPVGLGVWGFFAIRKAWKKAEAKAEAQEDTQVDGE